MPIQDKPVQEQSREDSGIKGGTGNGERGRLLTSVVIIAAYLEQRRLLKLGFLLEGRGEKSSRVQKKRGRRETVGRSMGRVGCCAVAK